MAASLKRQPVATWQPIAEAPKNGTEIECRGHNYGDKANGRHRHIAYWNGNEWRDAYDEDLTLLYLDEWRPYEGRQH